MSQSTVDRATNVLLDMVNITVQSMNDVVEFGKQQIPDVIHQLLMWKAVESGIAMLFAIAVVIFGILLMTTFRRRSYKAMQKRQEAATLAYEEGESWTRYNGNGETTSYTYDNTMAVTSALPYILFLVGGFLTILGFVSITNHFDWLKILIAPKVYLIEYAADIVKTIK